MRWGPSALMIPVMRWIDTLMGSPVLGGGVVVRSSSILVVRRKTCQRCVDRGWNKDVRKTD
jgi:hypothetical protein